MATILNFPTGGDEPGGDERGAYDFLLLTGAQREALTALRDSARRLRGQYAQDSAERDTYNWIAYDLTTRVLTYPVTLQRAQRLADLLRFWRARVTTEGVEGAEQAIYREAADQLAAVLTPAQRAFVAPEEVPARRPQQEAANWCDACDRPLLPEETHYDGTLTLCRACADERPCTVAGCAWHPKEAGGHHADYC